MVHSVETISDKMGLADIICRKVKALLRRLLPRPAFRAGRSIYFRSRSTVSQAGQDFWVFGEAHDGKRGGYFVDVGAADGVNISNTFVLEKRFAWRGICIEANPKLFRELRHYRSAICVNACVDSCDGEIDYLMNNQLGGIIDEATDNRPNCITAEKAVSRMRTRRLDEILDKHGAPAIIDYLSVDVEGAETRVLSSFPFERYQFNCITVERPKEALRTLLKENGYILVREVPRLDSFYIHQSFTEKYLRNLECFWEKG